VFPAGVVNVITDANDLGPHLTAHPDVAKIGFTGSTATGKRIAASGRGYAQARHAGTGRQRSGDRAG
jgi:acyl-CoA reductase-like NAD-dependent aldehyde dehydrogenase